MALSKPTIPEPPRISTLDELAPKFRVAVEAILADVSKAGYHAKVFESLRTDERQKFLYGFGREYDDGRGPVTKSMSANKSWHGFGMAVDIVEDDATPWTAPQAFWQAIGAAAEKYGCTWGGSWRMIDLPHVQYGKCPQSPSTLHQKLLAEEGVEAVWQIFEVA